MIQDYGRRIVLDLPFERGVSVVVQALREEGFEVVMRLDIRELLRRTIREDSRRYILLGVSSPDVILTVLRQELDAGTILPITLAVYELADHETVVAAGEPFASLMSDRHWQEDRPDLATIATDVEARIARVLERLTHKVRAALHPE